ncbi:MAG: GWxTD domain-containing protein [Bacteroidota bacterium]
MRNILIGILLTGMVMLYGCKATEESASEAPPVYLASLYNPSQLSLHPDYCIFHESDNFSVLYIRAYPAELKFSQANEDSEYRALLSIGYKLIRLDAPGLEGDILDSATVTYKLGSPDEKRPAFFATLTIPVQSGKRYLLKLEAKDLNRGSIGLEYLYVDKFNEYSGQNFKVVSLFSGYPKFMRYFRPGEKFTVQYRKKLADSIYVDYFRLASELPRPPITASADYTLNYSPDTSFVFPLVDSIDYNLQRKGMYFVRVDRAREEGLSLFNFGGSFPEIKTPDELMEPLFYLATLAEYRDLRKEPNRKLAVDNFWLKMGNSVEKSRELIRIYYNRAVYSNLYFTANKEGWKTDRGMIFILFGPPRRIQMTGTGERWYYYVRRRSNPVEFRFDRRADAFANQNLEWVKTTDSQMFWNEAVRSWRSGKVYSPGS